MSQMITKDGELIRICRKQNKTTRLNTQRLRECLGTLVVLVLPMGIFKI